jgi:hypothetical protein
MNKLRPYSKVEAKREQSTWRNLVLISPNIRTISLQTMTQCLIDQTASQAADQAARHGINLLAVEHVDAKRGFVLLPRRWLIERTLAGRHDFAG